MQDLNITLIQCTQFWENKLQNLNHYEELLDSISTSDLVLLPEMFHTGFSMNAKELAERESDSMALNWLKKQALERQTAIYTSFIAEDNGKFYNRGVFVFPSGEYTFYDKRQLFTLAKEEKTYTPGRKQVIVSYKNWRINLQICYDLRFPEVSRNKELTQNVNSYDLCLYVANWPEKRAHHWKSLLTARAIENQAFVAGLNRIGIDGNGFTYTGDSMVYSPLGEKLTGDFPGEEKVLQLKIQKKSLEEVRKKLNFLKDARI